MHGNESSHGSQPTQCGYRVVHRRLVLGSPISPVPSVPGRRLASSLGPFACRVDSRGGSGCGESERKAGVRRMGFRISDFGEWVYGASGIRSLGISGHRGGSPEFLRSLGKIPPRTFKATRPILGARVRTENTDSNHESQSTPSEYRVECADLFSVIDSSHIAKCHLGDQLHPKFSHLAFRNAPA